MYLLVFSSSSLISAAHNTPRTSGFLNHQLPIGSFSKHTDLKVSQYQLKCGDLDLQVNSKQNKVQQVYDLLQFPCNSILPGKNTFPSQQQQQPPDDLLNLRSAQSPRPFSHERLLIPMEFILGTAQMVSECKLESKSVAGVLLQFN